MGNGTLLLTVFAAIVGIAALTALLRYWLSGQAGQKRNSVIRRHGFPQEGFGRTMDDHSRSA